MRVRWLGSISISVALVCAGCLGTAGPGFESLVWPALEGEHRVEVSVTSIDKLPDRERIFDLASLGPDSLRIVGAQGLYLRSAEGLESLFRFESDERHSMITQVRGAGARFVGQRAPSGDIYLYSESGAVLERVPVHGKGRLRLGRLTRGATDDLLFRPRSGKELQVWGLDRQLLAAVTTEHYLTAFAADDFDGDGVGELILYEYPVEKGAGRFRAIRATGESICSWPTPIPIGDFTVLPWPSSEPGTERLAILTNPGDSFVVTALCGETLAELEVDNASWFRSTKTTWIGDRWIAIVATGSGYRPYFMLTLFDTDGTLVFRQAGEGRAGAIEATDNGFFVAIDNEVRHYEIR